MSVSNGFGSFWVGTSGIKSSSDGIYVTGNNLSNLHTTGYVRQRLLQSDSIYNTMPTTSSAMTNAATKIGLGVTSAEILHTRDVFLDKYYRQENGRASFYETMNETTDEIETILQELEGEAFETSLDDFWQAFAELAKDPSDSVNQELVVQKASLFISKAQSLIKSMKEYQTNLNEQVEGTVDTINSISEQIADLNVKIQTIEAGGQETAYTLRDERDQLLDELSQYVKIEYTELDDTTVRVKVDGVLLVEGRNNYTMSTYTDDATGYVNPVWDSLSSDNQPYYVYDLTTGYNTEQNSDIGQLKALLLSRGDETSNYIDGLGLTDSSETVDLTGESTASCLLQDVEAMLDTLVHEMVTQINDLYSPLTDGSGTITLAEDVTINGVSYSAGDTLDLSEYQIWDDSGYLGSDDSPPGQELFSRLFVDRYTEVTDDDGNTYYIYNEEDTDDIYTSITSGDVVYKYTETTDDDGNVTVSYVSDSGDVFDLTSGLNYSYCDENGAARDNTTLYSITNLQVNPLLTANATLMPYHDAEGNVALDLGESLNAIWETDISAISDKDFVEYYSSIVEIVGNWGTTFDSFSETLDSTVTEIESSRQQVTSVSSDEELSNMIKYQNAYNAASRYINVIDDMVEIIVTLV
ncbi:MAG: flagellar hook-associated protein FlgK [Eubacterium sp.]|nr:flagellar hook-associated protein FlgK [Eubacterium sp.]